MHTPPRDVAISSLADRQHGVVARAQLLALGLERRAIRRRLAAGRLHPIHRGVYAVGHTVLSRWGWSMAAVLAGGEGAVLSHRSAASLWALRRGSAARIDITVPFTSGVRGTQAITVHRARAPIESTVEDGIPVTTVARTLADLAEVVPRRALEKALETAEAHRKLDVAEIDAVAAAHPGRLGPALVRKLVRGHDVESTTRGSLEDAFLELCETHGIPRPAVNARIGPYEVDFCWPAARLIVETDSWRHHGTRAAFRRDAAKAAALTAMGWRVVRVVDEQIAHDALATAERILELLDAARPRPAGGTGRTHGASR
jgi:hypothetical protein